MNGRTCPVGEDSVVEQIRIFAKSPDERGYKEPLADHTLHDLQTGLRLIKNLPFGHKKRRRLTRDLTEAIAFHDVGKAAIGFQTSRYW